MKKIISIAIVVFLIIPVLFSQNEVLLTDGTVYRSDGEGIVQSDKVLVYSNNKLKSRLIDTSEVFAIINKEDTTFLYDYKNYPLDEAKLFVQGQIDGKNYKNTKACIGAFVFGVASPILVYSFSLSQCILPLLPTGYTTIFSKINLNKPHKSFDLRYKDNISYQRGYKLSATKEKIKQVSIYSAAGVVTGISTMLLIPKTCQ